MGLEFRKEKKIKCFRLIIRVKSKTFGFLSFKTLKDLAFFSLVTDYFLSESNYCEQHIFILRRRSLG